MQQLKFLVNRTNVPSKPSKNVNAAEDFIRIVTIGHVVAAAMSYFKMTDENDEPIDKCLRSVAITTSKMEKEGLFRTAILNMLKSHVILTTLDSSDSPESSDKVNIYAKETLSLSMCSNCFCENGTTRMYS